MPTTLSTQAPADIAERVDHVAEIEQRKRSQVILHAVDFWSRLSPETHLGISRLQASGDDVAGALYRRIAREVLDAQFAVVEARIVKQMQVPEDVVARLGDDPDDDSLFDAASELVRRAQPSR